MTKRQLVEYCLRKKNVELEFPVGPQYAVFKVRKSPQTDSCSFAEVFELEGRLKLTFRSAPETAEKLRAQFEGAVDVAFHCRPKEVAYRSTADAASLTDDELQGLVDISYAYALASIPDVRTDYGK